MALKHSSSSLLEISTAQSASRFCWGMKARVWSSWWSRLTGDVSPWTLWRSCETHSWIYHIENVVYAEI